MTAEYMTGGGRHPTHAVPDCPGKYIPVRMEWDPNTRSWDLIHYQCPTCGIRYELRLLSVPSKKKPD